MVSRFIVPIDCFATYLSAFGNTATSPYLFGSGGPSSNQTQNAIFPKKKIAKSPQVSTDSNKKNRVDNDGWAAAGFAHFRMSLTH